MGLRNSDGKVPDPGVAREEAASELGRLSKPAAAIVAVAVAEAMVNQVFLSETSMENWANVTNGKAMKTPRSWGLA